MQKSGALYWADVYNLSERVLCEGKSQRLAPTDIGVFSAACCCRGHGVKPPPLLWSQTYPVSNCIRNRFWIRTLNCPSKYQEFLSQKPLHLVQPSDPSTGRQLLRTK